MSGPKTPEPSAAARDRKLAFALVALVALVPRVVYLVQLWSASPTFWAPEGGDSMFYDQMARGGFTPDRAYFHSPLYQWFLAGIYAVVGRDLVVVRLLQHALGVVTALIVTDLGWRVLGRWRPAVVGGLLYALAGPPTFYEGHLLVDALVPPLVAGTTWLAIRELERPSPRRALGVGIALGVGALARGTFLLWLPVVAWWMWRTPPRGWLRPATLALGTALVIAPVTVRNYVVERDFVLTAANAGLNLYIGNNPRAHGAYVLPPGVWFRAGDPSDDFRGLAVATEALGHVPTSSELSRWWSRRATEYALHHPLKTLDSTLAKARLTLTDYEFPQLYHYYGYRAVAPVLGWLPSAGWLLAPGLLGLAILRRRCRTNVRVRLFSWLLLVQAAGFLPFFVVGRYRTGLLVLAAPLAGLAIVGARRRWRHATARGRVGIALSVAISGFVVFGPPPASFHAGPQYHGFGQACMSRGERAQAKRWHARALEARANFEPSLHPLVEMMLEDGELDEAERLLDAAIERGADTSPTFALLGQIKHAQGELEPAERALKAAIEAEPGNTDAWRAYGRVLVDLGRHDEARAALESAAALEDDPEKAAALQDEARRVRG